MRLLVVLAAILGTTACSSSPIGVAHSGLNNSPCTTNDECIDGLCSGNVCVRADVTIRFYPDMDTCRTAQKRGGGTCLRFDDGEVEGIYHEQINGGKGCIDFAPPPGTPTAALVEVADDSGTEEVVGAGTCANPEANHEFVVEPGEDKMVPSGVVAPHGAYCDPYYGCGGGVGIWWGWW